MQPLQLLTEARLDQQPRRFIYPKDGGRFDAPKIHVFTHLLRKCFTGKSKVRLRPPKSTIYGGSKWPLFTPKTAWIKLLKIVLWGPLNNEMAKTVTLGSANPPTVTNLRGRLKNCLLFTPKTAWIKIAQKRPLESTERKNDEDSNFRFG